MLSNLQWPEQPVEKQQWSKPVKGNKSLPVLSAHGERLQHLKTEVALQFLFPLQLPEFLRAGWLTSYLCLLQGNCWSCAMRYSSSWMYIQMMTRFWCVCFRGYFCFAISLFRLAGKIYSLLCFYAKAIMHFLSAWKLSCLFCGCFPFQDAALVSRRSSNNSSNFQLLFSS